jgi:hypothetical protein
MVTRTALHRKYSVDSCPDGTVTSPTFALGLFNVSVARNRDISRATGREIWIAASAR